MAWPQRRDGISQHNIKNGMPVYVKEDFPNPMAAKVISIITRTIRVVFVATAAANSHEKVVDRQDSIIICQWLTGSKETKNEGR